MLEVTTHNLYFHEQSSIFSIDSYSDILCTGGGDGVARIWKVETDTPSTHHDVNSSSNILTHKDSLNPSTMKYRTALDSSTKIEYISDLHTHNKTVNCVRFNSKGQIASCSDGGKVLVSPSPSLGASVFSVRDPDGNDCYDLLWIDSFLVVGTGSGLVEVFSLAFGTEFVVKKVFSRKIHSDMVQGLAHSPLNNLLVTFCKDNSSCLLIFNSETGKLSNQDKLEATNKFFSTSRGFYRRNSFSKDQKFLYLVSCKTNSLVVLSHPFRDEHLYCKIGPMDSEVIRVVENKDNFLYVVTKKSVYIFKKSLVLETCIENISFKSTTDGTICCGILFVSSLDGFISSLKITE